MAKGKRDPNWKEKIREWESSNKSLPSWCKENKIPYTTFLGWKARLKKADDKMIKIPKNHFIELKETSSSSDPGIFLEYQGIKIQLERSFDKATLKECLECLRDIRC